MHCLAPAPPWRSCAGFYQRRVAAARLLGELYNYKLLNSHVVFATLHLILAYGHEAGTPPEVTRWVGAPVLLSRFGVGKCGWQASDAHLFAGASLFHAVPPPPAAVPTPSIRQHSTACPCPHTRTGGWTLPPTSSASASCARCWRCAASTSRAEPPARNSTASCPTCRWACWAVQHGAACCFGVGCCAGSFCWRLEACSACRPRFMQRR